MPASLSLQELFDYTQAETDKWETYFRSTPTALDLKIDIAEAPDVRTLVLHILGVELIFADLLHRRDVTDFEQLPAATVEDLFAIGKRARADLQSFLSTATDADWQSPIAFHTQRFGTLPGSKRKSFVHAMLHGVRHWAQLATALRASGFKPGWNHDFLFTKAME